MSDAAHTGTAIRLTIETSGKRLELNVTNPVSLDDVFDALKRAGITELHCDEVRGQRIQDGFQEQMIFSGMLPD